MARYRSTIEVQVWKEHACVGCGGAYRYLLRRKSFGLGPTPDDAIAAAHQAVPRVVGRAADMEPCPDCGLYQPDMVGARRFYRHLIVFYSAAALLLVALIVGMYWLGGVGGQILLLSAAAVTAAGAAHLLVESWNPNRNLAANCRVAKERLEAGRLDRVKEGAAAANPNPQRDSRAPRWIALTLLGLSLAAFCSAEGMRLVVGAPLNPHCNPPIAGPGDSVEIEFPDRFASVDGRWNGEAKLQLLNAAEVGLPADLALPVTSNTDQWGDAIRVSGGYSEREVHPWVKVDLPQEQAVGGKTIKAHVDLAVKYPKEKETGTDPANGGEAPDPIFLPDKKADQPRSVFVVTKASFDQDYTLQTASVAFVGELYRRLVAVGLFFGHGGYLIAAVVLIVAAALSKRRALPAKVYVPSLS